MSKLQTNSTEYLADTNADINASGFDPNSLVELTVQLDNNGVLGSPFTWFVSDSDLGALQTSFFVNPAYAGSTLQITATEVNIAANGAVTPVAGVAPATTQVTVAASSSTTVTPTVTTDLPDYSPGSTATFTASGFSAGDTIQFATYIINPMTDAVLSVGPTLTGVAGANGVATTQFSVTSAYAGTTVELTAMDPTAGLSAATTFTDSSGASLSQWANQSPGSWINGDLNGNKATYFEGDDVPFQLTFTGLNVGQVYSIDLQWDTSKSGDHAYDYLTTYNFNVPGDQPNPLTGVSLNGSLVSTLGIPLDPHVTQFVSQTSGQVFTFFGAQAGSVLAGNGGGTTLGVYDLTGSGSWNSITGYSGDTSEDVVITFTAEDTSGDAVLSFGAHVAQGLEAGNLSWGALNEFGAANISGAPYHMAIQAGDPSNSVIAGNKSQDRSLQSSVVVVPSINIEKLVSADGGTNWYVLDDNDHVTSSNIQEDDVAFLEGLNLGFNSSNLHTGVLNTIVGQTLTYEVVVTNTSTSGSGITDTGITVTDNTGLVFTVGTTLTAGQSEISTNNPTSVAASGLNPDTVTVNASAVTPVGTLGLSDSDTAEYNAVAVGINIEKLISPDGGTHWYLLGDDAGDSAGSADFAAISNFSGFTGTLVTGSPSNILAGAKLEYEVVVTNTSSSGSGVTETGVTVTDNPSSLIFTVGGTLTAGQIEISSPLVTATAVTGTHSDTATVHATATLGSTTQGVSDTDSQSYSAVSVGINIEKLVSPDGGKDWY
ncbi:hypothetical protein, partial [Bradyrhizobium macuxiense]|uniref:hypothetical protein n=1 Tax=Bradyrhizobium macuxiense TaxID=1755647 RepID=UPI00142F11FC